MQDNKLQIKEIQGWLNDPVTKQFMLLVQEHKNANEAVVAKSALGCKSLADLDLCELAEYRGQYQAFEQILDINFFLNEVTIQPKEVDNEEVDSTGSEFDN